MKGIHSGLAVDRQSRLDPVLLAGGVHLADRLGEIGDWDAVKLLSVRVDRLRRWYRPGLLCIGDAAHAMSPAGGVGLNLAIQDAVATANILGPSFHSGGPNLRHLRRVQRRRELPARAVQAFQVRALRDLYPKGGDDQAATVGGMAKASDRDPVAFRLVRALPALRHMAGRFIGYGIRPEHVRQGEHGPGRSSIGGATSVALTAGHRLSSWVRWTASHLPGSPSAT